MYIVKKNILKQSEKEGYTEKLMETEKKKIYTIDDIAKELGVSKTTVSRAISGKGRIGQSTRNRVLEFIEQHDYRPNAMAKGLAQKKTYNLALLLPKDYAMTEFPFFKDCMQGICEIASQYDYNVMISIIDAQDISQIQRLEENRKVDGIILSRAIEHSGVQEYLKKCREPVIVIGPAKDSDFIYVDNKNQEASKEMTKILLQQGVRKLALLGGNPSYSVTGSRYQGYAEAHKEMGRLVDDRLVYMNCEDSFKVTDALNDILEQGADGILCMDDVICGMCICSLREKNIQIPVQMRVASLYDSLSLQYNQPAVTSVSFDTIRLGMTAAVKILKILGEEIIEEPQQLHYQILQRES